jgi:hypothetical protein
LQKLKKKSRFKSALQKQYISNTTFSNKFSAEKKENAKILYLSEKKIEHIGAGMETGLKSFAPIGFLKRAVNTSSHTEKKPHKTKSR